MAGAFTEHRLIIEAGAHQSAEIRDQNSATCVHTADTARCTSDADAEAAP
jgi:hypothetical protein